MPQTFNYGIDQLTIAKTVELSNSESKAAIYSQAAKRILSSKYAVQKIVKEKQVVYGINTGFGALANTRISEKDTTTLQHKLLESHSVGVRDPVPAEIARIML